VLHLHNCQPVSWEQQYNYLIMGFKIIHTINIRNWKRYPLWS